MKKLIFLALFSSLVCARDFSKIDRHALNAPKSVESSVTKLAEYLQKPAQDDWEKTRALFRWLAANIEYDVDSYFSNSHKAMTPDDVLRSKKAVCDGYSGLFKMLADEMNLEAEVIHGYSKGANYSAGDTFSGPPDHAWCAVKIDGAWRLLDPTWGAGHIEMDRKFKRKFREFYFDVPPKKLIRTHFPTDPKWQLLKNPVQLNEFINWTFVKPPFFEYDLELTINSAVLKANKAMALSIKAPQNVVMRSLLIKNNQHLDRRLTLTQRNEENLETLVTFPQKGEYILRLFAKYNEKNIKLYDWVADYKIVVDNGNSDVLFPQAFGEFADYNCFLHGPQLGVLKNHKTHAFKIKVPNAKDVAIFMNGEFIPMEYKNGDWQKSIAVSAAEVSILAQFPGMSNYAYLLKYTTN